MSSLSPYATSTRPEIHSMIPESARRILDVGCNDGGFGAWLMESDPRREVWGVEPHPDQAAKAGRLFSGGVIEGYYPDALERIPGEFDCVTFNHVLEHIIDPWAALRKTSERLTHNGVVVAVIPNVRYLPLITDLVFRGRWDYRDTGLLDRTHVRFFTRRSIVSMFHQAGLREVRTVPVNAIGSVSFPTLSRLVSATLRDLTYGGFAVAAKR